MDLIQRPDYNAEMDKHPEIFICSPFLVQVKQVNRSNYFQARRSRENLEIRFWSANVDSQIKFPSTLYNANDDAHYYLDNHVPNEDDEGDGKGDDEALVDHLGVHLEIK